MSEQPPVTNEKSFKLPKDFKPTKDQLKHLAKCLEDYREEKEKKKDEKNEKERLIWLKKHVDDAIDKKDVKFIFELLEDHTHECLEIEDYLKETYPMYYEKYCILLKSIENFFV